MLFFDHCSIVEVAYFSLTRPWALGKGFEAEGHVSGKDAVTTIFLRILLEIA